MKNQQILMKNRLDLINESHVEMNKQSSRVPAEIDICISLASFVATILEIYERLLIYNT